MVRSREAQHTDAATSECNKDWWRCANIVGTGKTWKNSVNVAQKTEPFCHLLLRLLQTKLVRFASICTLPGSRIAMWWRMNLPLQLFQFARDPLPLWFLMLHPLPLPGVWWLDTTGDVNWPQNDAMSSPSAPALPSSRSFASAAKHWASPMCRGVHCCAVCHLCSAAWVLKVSAGIGVLTVLRFGHSSASAFLPWIAASAWADLAVPCSCWMLKPWSTPTPGYQLPSSDIRHQAWLRGGNCNSPSSTTDGLGCKSSTKTPTY